MTREEAMKLKPGDKVVTRHREILVVQRVVPDPLANSAWIHTTHGMIYDSYAIERVKE